MDSNTGSATDWKLWILLTINVLLLIERTIKNSKFIKCSRHGCMISNQSMREPKNDQHQANGV